MFLFQANPISPASVSIAAAGNQSRGGSGVDKPGGLPDSGSQVREGATIGEKKVETEPELDMTKVVLNFIFNGGSSFLNLFTFLNANFLKMDFLQEKLQTASDVLTRIACGVQGAVLAIDSRRKKNLVCLVANSLDIPIVASSDPSEIWFNRGWSQGGSQSDTIVNEFVDKDGTHYSSDFSKTGWIEGLKTSFKIYGKIIKDLFTDPSSFNKSSHSLFVASFGQIFFTTLGHLGSKIIAPLGRDGFGALVDYGLILAKKSISHFWAGTTWVGAAVVDGMKRFDTLAEKIPCLTNLSFAFDRGASVLYTLGILSGNAKKSLEEPAVGNLNPAVG